MSLANIDNYPLLKSRVKAHQRRTKTGKIVQVREHEDRRTKDELGKKPVEEQAKTSKTAEEFVEARGGKADPLIEEAKKYKTAEEFIKSNNPMNMPINKINPIIKLNRGICSQALLNLK